VTAAEIAHLLNARRCGKGWLARCPAHDDQTPSLSIAEGRNSVPLLTCHAGCSYEAIRAALDLHSPSPPVEAPVSRGRRREADYTYRDSEGRVIVTVTRWRLPNGDKTFIREPKGIDASAVPVYRLPDLRDSLRVVVVEGEKDADRLWALGIPATTNASGAGKWQPHHAGQLAKQGVTHAVLLPDNDAAGERHMHAVAAALRSAGLGVSWCALPDRPPKGDVTDVLERGLSVERLRTLLDEAPAYVPPADLALVTKPNVAPGVRKDPTLDIVSASSIQPRPIAWLWPGRIALGKTAMIAGHPGLGKSQLTCWLAAVVSKGGLLPDGGRAPLGGVLMVSAEDDPADTIVPRMIAAGADLTRVHLLAGVREATDGQTRERGFDLVRDVPWLHAALADRTDVRLVVIDPVTAYMGMSDTHRTSDVRAVLRPLERLAQHHSVAIVLVSHLNKAGGSEALLRVTGSLAFVAAARAGFLVVRDPDDDHRRLLLEAKNNLGPETSGLAFRVEDARVAGDLATSRIVWTGEAVTVTANDVLAAPVTVGEARTAVQEAAEWLREALADGPLPRRTLEAAARNDGLAVASLKRGASLAGVKMTRVGFGTGSIWSLASPFGSSDAQSAHPLNASRMHLNEPSGAQDCAVPVGHGSSVQGGEPSSVVVDSDDTLTL